VLVRVTVRVRRSPDQLIVLAPHRGLVERLTASLIGSPNVTVKLLRPVETPTAPFGGSVATTAGKCSYGSTPNSIVVFGSGLPSKSRK